MVMRYDRASRIVWPQGFSPDKQVLKESTRVWVTAGGVCAPLEGPLTALQLMDAVLRLERGEPLDKVYAPNEKDDWTSDEQKRVRCNDLAGETPWIKTQIGQGGWVHLHDLDAATGDGRGLRGGLAFRRPSNVQSACPRRGFCGLTLYGRKKGTGEPVYRPLWSGLFCGGCAMGRNLAG